MISEESALIEVERRAGRRCCGLATLPGAAGGGASAHRGAGWRAGGEPLLRRLRGPDGPARRGRWQAADEVPLAHVAVVPD